MAFQIEALFLMWELFWKWIVFWFKGLFTSFLSKERVWLKSVPFMLAKKGVMVRRVLEKWVISDQRAPRHQSRWFQSITVLGLVFLVIERVWQVWSYSKSWRIPNYQISKPTKTYHFLLLDFRRIWEKKSLNQEFYNQLSEQAWSEGSFDFLKIVPLEAPRSLIQMVSKRKGVFIEMDLSPIVITNSFKIQNQTFQKHFHHFFIAWFSMNSRKSF